MRDTGESAEHLNELLAADIGKCERNQDKIRQAFRDVMAAVRDGRLTVLARPALRHGKPNISAVHHALDPLLFEGPRAISIFGKVDYSGLGEPGFGFLDYDGPWFDEARFDAGQVQALWPAPPGACPSADAWMLEEAKNFIAERKAKPKRDDLVDRCMTATRCTARDARAAFQRLPPCLRRKVGRPAGKVKPNA